MNDQHWLKAGRTAVRPALKWIACLAFAGRLFTCGAAEGIFAEFTTSLGVFTCQLTPEQTPQTVANFIGLATGDRPWMDPETGAVRSQPFYEGLTFHRVIDGFMNQCGSRNGQGSDGPGYAFPDEFDSSLRHDGPGVLSMANSGPNSNGSQFFVTVTATPHLDDRHAVFGRVVEGMEVVNAINSVQTDAQDRPLVPVVLQHVIIRRVGAAAESFNIHDQDLPVVARQSLGLGLAPTEAELSFTQAALSDLRLSESSDLRSWTLTSVGITLDEPLEHRISRSRTNPAGYFALTSIQYPASTRAPPALRNRELALVFNANQGTLAIAFDDGEGGTFDYSGSSGTVESYAWIQDAYRGHLWPIYFRDWYLMTLRLDFSSETEGTFTGKAYPPSGPPTDVGGGFTLTRP